MFKRSISSVMKLYGKFPVLAIIGPRQSGKTTLAKKLFPKHTFISFEIPANRMFALQDPERFLLAQENKHGIILDEFQYVPQLLSYIQVIVDAQKKHNYFILTGSQNFLMSQAITQSLAGRVGLITLMPLALQELKQNKLLPENPHELIFNGSYPRIYDEQMDPSVFYASYVQTYVERDVRQLVAVGDLEAFQKFIQLCAARIGNLLNLSDVAMGCGVSVPTARRWLSILQASYIVFLLEPHFTNFNKRLTKLPKLYFYDTGLACNVLRIPSAQNLLINQYWGSLFENCIIADVVKQYYNRGVRPPVYFWRDKNGRIEIDCLIDDGTRLFPVEIKASQTITARFFDGLAHWQELTKGGATLEVGGSNSFLVYAGTRRYVHTHAIVIPWKESGALVAKVKERIVEPASQPKKRPAVKKKRATRSRERA